VIYYWNEQGKEVEMGGGGGRGVQTGFWLENLKEIHHLEDKGVGRRLILKLIFEK
jgi:hypothetical protein